MEGHAVPIVVDLIMIGLLIGTIIHSMHLSKSLQNFKRIYGEIVPMMHEQAKNLAVQVGQIEEMKKVSTEIDRALNSKVPAALTLKKDLEFLIDRANEMADHLEFMIKFDREREFSVLQKSSQHKSSPQFGDKKKSEETVFQESGEKGGQKQQNKEEETRMTQSTKPFSESFSLTRTAKKLFAKTTPKNSRKDKAQGENYAA